MNLSTILTIAAAIAEQHPGCDDVVMDFVDELYAATVEADRALDDDLSDHITADVRLGIDAIRRAEGRDLRFGVLTWRRAMSDHFGSDYHQVLADIADCEQCGRTKGHLCETVDGNVAKQPHAVRVKQAHIITRGTLPSEAADKLGPAYAVGTV